jgi:DNA invertase Pin-like site-specific DNA recombinase
LPGPDAGREGRLDIIGGMSDEERSDTTAGRSGRRTAKKKASHDRGNTDRGRLKIGDDWNAIRIIALSQSNPLKAIAEFVENSIASRGYQISSTSPRIFATPSSGD